MEYAAGSLNGRMSKSKQTQSKRSSHVAKGGTPVSGELAKLQRQIEEQTKASRALQRTVDALASLRDLDRLVPVVMGIIAEAFSANDCKFFTHRGDEPIRLLYWFSSGKVFSASELCTYEGPEAADLKRLVAGFDGAEPSLPTNIHKRIRAAVLEGSPAHFPWIEKGSLLSGDGEFTLNVPLVVAGEAEATISLLREPGSSYSQAEISLAESLGQQLSLAMEVSRISLTAEQTAIDRRQEIEALQRAQELAHYSDDLRQTLDSLTGEPEFLEFVGKIMTDAALRLRAPVIEYWVHEGEAAARLVLTCKDAKVYSGSDLESDVRTRGIAVIPQAIEAETLQARESYIIIDDLPNNPVQRALYEGTDFDLARWCSERRVQRVINIPLQRGNVSFGAIFVYFPREREYDTRTIQYAKAAAVQISLAIRLSDLADTSRQAAVSRERELLSEARADEAARYSEVLRKTVDSLAGEQDLEQFLGSLLVIASEQLQAPVIEYWNHDGGEIARLLLTCRDGRLYNGSDVAGDVRVRGVAVPSSITQVDSLFDCDLVIIDDILANKVFRQILEKQGTGARWCEERGVGKIIHAPLRRSGKAFGSLGFLLPLTAEVTQSKLDLIQSLAQQVALAVRMIELAIQSKQTAIAGERQKAAEDRSRELSRANEVLRWSLEQLSKEGEVSSFPRAILRTAIKHLGGAEGIILVYDAQARTLQASEYIFYENQSSELPGPVIAPVAADATPIWNMLVSKREPIVFDIERDASLMLPGAAAWHRQRGHRCVVITPMFIDAEPYGYFGVALREPAEQVSTISVGLVHALTQQASLAIQLTRLAEESKLSAIAREREQAAHSRAAELANANEVLRSMLDQLSRERDLYSFPATILREAMSQTGAHDGLLLVLDAAADALVPSVYIAAEVPFAAPGIEFQKPFSASATGAWAALVQKGSPIVFDVDRDRAMLLPGLSDWHKKRGNRSIIAAPMFVSGEPYGYFGVTLTQPVSDVSPVLIGLIHALAQQATLAVQLTRLAETSQQAAIVVERQHVIVQERAHMAREIHDRLAQGYAAILIQQHALRRSALKEPQRISEYLDKIERLSRENLADARKTIDELSINPFGPIDLHEALQSCIHKFSSKYEFDVRLQVESELPAVPRYLETELCRVVGEALTNSFKHSRASLAQVSSHYKSGKLRIQVEDQGTGFDLESTAHSFGLKSMHERAARAGAELSIHSSPGRGTQVSISLAI